MCAKEFDVESPKVDNSCKNNCGICGTFPKALLKTVCGHQFCNICIKNWIKHNNKSCPKCRFQFPTLEKSISFTDFMVSESIVFRRLTETPISESRDKYKSYPNIKIVYIKSLTNGTDFKSCNVCGFDIKNSFHNCFELLKRSPQKLKQTFNRLKTENFNLKEESSQQRGDECTPQWKVGYENSIKSLNQTNRLHVQKGRQSGLTINELNHKIFDYKGMVRDMTASKDHWKSKFKRQTTVIRHIKTNNQKVKHGLINKINKQKRTYFKQLTKLYKKFNSIERRVNEEVYELKDENFDLKDNLEALKDHYCDTISNIIIGILNTVLNNQQINEDNQMSKFNELQLKYEELEQKLLITENELLISKNRLEFDFELDLQELQLDDHTPVDKQDQSVVVKRGTKRRLQTEMVSTNQQIFGTKDCKPKFRDIKMRVNYKNEELSKEICLKDEFFKRLTDKIEKQSLKPIKLSTEYILMGTHRLFDYKIVMFKESTTYDSELDDRSFSVMHSSIEELMFCLDKSHQLMITKIDGTVSDYIRQRIQLEEYPNNGWFDPESKDPSETYIIVHFPDNTTEIWIRMALILLLFEYKPKFIDKREARFILNRAHPSRSIQP